MNRTLSDAAGRRDIEGSRPGACSGAAQAPFTIGFDRSALDPEFKAHAGRGIGRYVAELARYFDRNCGESPSGEGVTVGRFDYRSFRLPKPVDLALSSLPLGRQTVRQQLFYPLQLRAGAMAEFRALHFPAHMDAPSWSVTPYALTVLDLIPLIFRELYEAGRSGLRFRFARWLELRAIKGASLILAISECTARDVTRILGVLPEKIAVTPLGVDGKFFLQAAPSATEALRRRLAIPVDSPIVLYVGGIDQRKNTKGLLSAFSRVAVARRERGLAAPRLVMAGKIEKDRLYAPLLAEVKSRGLGDLVVLPGFVPDAELPALYGMSSVFLFPSLYEGFGLPPLEALAAGLPVVSSNASAMPEVLGGAALLVPPESDDAMARSVLDVLDNPGLAADLSAGGPTRARMFSWERTGRLTMEAYARLARSLGA